MKVFIILALALVCVLAAEEQRVKKDVIVNGVRVLGIDEHGYDDGSYWPGKYWGTWEPTAYSAWPWASHWGHPWGARAWWGW